MKVVVCVKQTPSTTATFKVENDAVSWEDTGSGKPNVVNPWDEYAVEEGIRLKENHGAKDVVALTAGGEDAIDVLRTGLAMGCTEAVHVSDASLVSADANDTAAVLAAAVEKIGDASIVITGKQAIDADRGLTTVMVARKLGWTPLTFVAAINEIADGTITVERMVEGGRQVVKAKLPVVMSVVREINEPRYPSFMGIRKANRAKVPAWSLADLGVEVKGAPNVARLNIAAPEARVGDVELMDGSVDDQVKALVDRLFEDKVI